MSPHFRMPHGRVAVLLAVLSAAVSAHSDGAARASPPPPTLTLVAPGLSSPASLDYQVSTESLIVAVHPSPRGRPLERVTIDGERSEFGKPFSLPPGAPLAIAQDEEALDEGQIFTSRGNVGEVARIASEGSTPAAWARLPGETGTVTALTFSHGGPYGFDLIVGTSSGNVWRVSGGGHPVFVASLGRAVQALLALPALPSLYGGVAGQLLAALGEPRCQIVALDALGRPSIVNASACVTDLDLIVPDADVYFTGTATVNGKPVTGLFVAPAGGLQPVECDVLLTRAQGPPVVLDWSAGTLDVSVVDAQGGVINRAAFAGSALSCQPEVCGDGIDNNGDGDIDEGCEEVCGDGVDNDSDGEIDEGCQEIGDDEIANYLSGIVDAGVPPRPADAGCTPDRWLEATSEWVSLTPKEPVGGVFEVPSTGPGAAIAAELLRSILVPQPADKADPRGSARALVTAATAAVLNATQPAVGYPIPSAAIKEHVRGALAAGSPEIIRALTSVLEAYNRLGCELPAPPQQPR